MSGRGVTWSRRPHGDGWVEGGNGAYIDAEEWVGWESRARGKEPLLRRTRKALEGRRGKKPLPQGCGRTTSSGVYVAFRAPASSPTTDASQKKSPR